MGYGNFEIFFPFYICALLNFFLVKTNIYHSERKGYNR